jgi:hypothetical protein
MCCWIFVIISCYDCVGLIFYWKTSLITADLSLLLKKCTQTLKSVTLGYPFFNFSHPFEFFVKSYRNFQNIPVFIYFF